MPDLVFISVGLFDMNQAKECSKSTIRTRFKICSQFNSKDTRKTLEYILNIEQLSHFILVLKLLTLNR